MITDNIITDLAVYIDIQRRLHLHERSHEVAEIIRNIDIIRNNLNQIYNARRIDCEQDSAIEDLFKSVD